MWGECGVLCQCSLICSVWRERGILPFPYAISCTIPGGRDKRGYEGGRGVFPFLVFCLIAPEQLFGSPMNTCFPSGCCAGGVSFVVRLFAFLGHCMGLFVVCGCLPLLYCWLYGLVHEHCKDLCALSVSDGGWDVSSWAMGMICLGSLLAGGCGSFPVFFFPVVVEFYSFFLARGEVRFPSGK